MKRVGLGQELHGNPLEDATRVSRFVMGSCGVSHRSCGDRIHAIWRGVLRHFGQTVRSITSRNVEEEYGRVSGMVGCDSLVPTRRLGTGRVSY